MHFDVLDDGPLVMKAPQNELDEWMSRGFETRIQKYGHNLFLYCPTSYPHKIDAHQITNPANFVSLSITGTNCSLMCKHCEGRFLKGMESTMTPSSLFARCQEVSQLGGEGVLISGGSDSRGHVVLDRFLDTIFNIKHELGLKVVVHTGLVDEPTAQRLGSIGIDAAMLDIIGNTKVSKDVYHISDGPSNMDNSMKILHDFGVPLVPHLLVGLDYGRLSGELEAIQMISQYNPEAVVIIALNPIRNTPMEKASPPTPEAIGRIMTVTRLGIPDSPLLLGCARPLGKHKIVTDKFAIRSGANGIAYASQEGFEYAKELGLNPIFRDVCCSLAYQMIGTDVS